MNTKRNVLALLIAGFIFLQAGLVNGQSDYLKSDKTSDEISEAANSNESNDITGSWTATFTPTGSAPFQALLTFDQTGSVIASAQGDILLDPPPGLPPIATAVHGSWAKAGKRKYLATFKQIFYGADGSFQGGNKVRNLINLNSNGNQMSGHYQFDYTDANGNVVYSGTGTFQATRIEVEPLTP